jgi:hypothetical protein
MAPRPGSDATEQFRNSFVYTQEENFLEYGDKMIKHISIAAILLFLGACASSGPDATGSAASAVGDMDAPAEEMAANAETKDNPNEIVCRRESLTGSRMTTRVCRTRAEIEAREAKDQEALRNSRATQTGSECMMDGSC